MYNSFKKLFNLFLGLNITIFFAIPLWEIIDGCDGELSCACYIFLNGGTSDNEMFMHYILYRLFFGEWHLFHLILWSAMDTIFGEHLLILIVASS